LDKDVAKGSPQRAKHKEKLGGCRYEWSMKAAPKKPWRDKGSRTIPKKGKTGGERNLALLPKKIEKRKRALIKGGEIHNYSGGVGNKRRRKRRTIRKPVENEGLTHIERRTVTKMTNSEESTKKR